MKNLSLVTSAGIVNRVLAVLWELAELFDKLEQWGDAAFVYETYLDMITKDEDIEKQANVMKRLVQIYDEEERYYLRNSMEAKLQEIIKKKNEKEWEYIGGSVIHKELFLKLIKYRRNPNVEVKHVDNVRVIISDEFCIGRGSDGTRVYLGLKKDGYGKAVKRIRRDNCITIAKKEKEMLSEFNAKESKFVVKYYYLEEDTETDYVYLILDLCEESLERFVASSTLQDLQKSLPEILRQVLKGLADLHCGPCPILLRDLKPSNVLRDTHGKFLIADFGISRKLKGGLKTYHTSSKKGTQD
ncbi:probable LRR receptor-like serine/threonine-protein kinase RPK1 [Xenia sp. Carnegie-2017]|uniref:probable LRR receptor-like serine/threonine-protein kinase RPK1 n=1 Tax=Xenia sp. Carnegie-2017 TaxID=2897299 RepID=UPI001F03739F|nr:probable LRR receptor-like serine/threonine-protein kinase RPK1 [Xenia sp. Carnegie-2017]